MRNVQLGKRLEHKRFPGISNLPLTWIASQNYFPLGDYSSYIMSTRSLSSRTLNTYIETLWYHPEYVTGHDYSIQMDYKLPDDRTYSWCVCFSEYFYQERIMPAVTIQLYEQRLSFFNIQCYHWYQLFLIGQHLFHLFLTTPWCFLEPYLPIFSPHSPDSLT